MLATASASDYRRVISELADTDACDAILTLFVPPLMSRGIDVHRAISAASKAATNVTIATVYMDRKLPGRRGGAVPRFAFPEDAVRALAHAVHYAEWRSRPTGEVPKPSETRSSPARAVISRALDAGQEWLAPTEVAELLACYGLPTAPTRVARNVEDAVAAAAEFDRPVAIKAIAAGLIHKSDVGAVKLGIVGEAAIRHAAEEIRWAVTNAGFQLEGMLIQPMAEEGVELLLGVTHDESFGPVIACGAGGINAELLNDVAVRITPLSDLDAAEMLRDLRTFPLLAGYRGRSGCDTAAIESMLVSLGELVEAHPEVAELDANPVVAGPTGAVIVDARIRVRRAQPTRPLGSLRS
jgi:acyl-CoA synthetase (NDP forming)